MKIRPDAFFYGRRCLSLKICGTRAAFTWAFFVVHSSIKFSCGTMLATIWSSIFVTTHKRDQIHTDIRILVSSTARFNVLPAYCDRTKQVALFSDTKNGPYKCLMAQTFHWTAPQICQWKAVCSAFKHKCNAMAGHCSLLDRNSTTPKLTKVTGYEIIRKQF